MKDEMISDLSSRHRSWSFGIGRWLLTGPVNCPSNGLDSTRVDNECDPFTVICCSANPIFIYFYKKVFLHWREGYEPVVQVRVPHSPHPVFRSIRQILSVTTQILFYSQSPPSDSPSAPSHQQTMDALSAAEILRQAARYSTVRPATWQGPLARGGPRHTSSDPSTTPTESQPRPFAHSTTTSHPQSQSLWHILEASVGGGQQGKVVSRLLQKQLMARVDNLAIDEIELMAGGADTGV